MYLPLHLILDRDKYCLAALRFASRGAARQEPFFRPNSFIFKGYSSER